MIVKKGNIVGLFNSMKVITGSNEKIHTKLRYSNKRNNHVIKGEIDALIEIDPTAKNREYETKRLELINSYAEKDESGNIIFLDEKNQVVNIPNEKEEELKGKIKELDEEWTPILTEIDKVWRETLEEEVDLDLYKIDVEWLPEFLTASEFEGYSIILKGVD